MTETTSRRRRKPAVRRVTYAKADRALLAIVALAECHDVSEGERVRLNAAADIVRALRDRPSR